MHRNTISPFFADAVTTNAWSGPHWITLEGRKLMPDSFAVPTSMKELCRLSTPTNLLFPNTFLIWHPDYVSIIGMFYPEPA